VRVREEWIAPAIEAIKKCDIAKEGKVPNEFKGYIDTFGAAIVQNGLIPAIIFFENKRGSKTVSSDQEKDKTADNREKLMKAILTLLQGEEKHKNLYDYIKFRENQGDDIKNIRLDISEASLALKLALRTFEFIKNGN